MKCRFHTASMKHHNIKLTLARHDQSTNSSAPCKEFFQLLGPCFTKQEKTEIGREIKCSQLERWTSMNHLVESQIALQHEHENPKSQRGSRRNTHGTHSQENCQETTKPTQFMWRVRNLHEQNLATMEEFDWHDILNNRKKTTRKIQAAVIRATIKRDG